MLAAIDTIDIGANTPSARPASLLLDYVDALHVDLRVGVLAQYPRQRFRELSHDQRSAAASRWSRRPRLWERALELARADPPPGPRCFIHRGYHPENTLCSRGRLTGVVDWTSAAWGPAAVDTAHMRWNLALTYGLDVCGR